MKILLTEKPRPDGLALAFRESKPSQSCQEAVIAARLGLAYLGLAWPGLWPQAGPCTALYISDIPGYISCITRYISHIFQYA